MELARFFIVLFLLPSCSNIKSKSTTLVICNKGENKIDSVKIASYGVNLIFKDLLPNDIKSQTANITPPDNVEGGFTIVIFQKDSIVYTGSFGYFSNYFLMKERYKINILKNYSINEVDP